MLLLSMLQRKEWGRRGCDIDFGFGFAGQVGRGWFDGWMIDGG